MAINSGFSGVKLKRIMTAAMVIWLHAFMISLTDNILIFNNKKPKNWAIGNEFEFACRV